MIRSLKVLAAVVNCDLEKLAKYAEWMKDETTRKNCYYTYQKKRSQGKFRTIAPSYHGLKDIQNRLMSRVFKHVIFPYHVVGSTKKRSGVINAKIHTGSLYHLQTDLVGFFDFVNYKNVYKALIALDFSADVAGLITQLTTLNGHLPQGAPTSPFLANLVGLALDRILLEYCGSMNLIYTRYVDDITMSGSYNFKKDVSLFLNAIKEAGFLYSHRKTVYKAGDIEVTGAKVTFKKIDLTDHQVCKIFSGTISDNSRRGLCGYFKHLRQVDKCFDFNDFKEKFSNLKFPERLLPYMNHKVTS